MARRCKAASRTAVRVPHATKLEVGTELGPDGHRIGRDPRQMKPEELRAWGFEPMPVLKIARLHCLDCCGGSADEVRKCTAVGCPKWHIRMGTNPLRPPASPAQREHARTLRAKRHRDASEAQSLSRPDAEPTLPVPE
jgi:hypothetical protein